MAKKTHLPIFVYGTLLPGQPNDHLWKTAVKTTEPAIFHGGQLHDMGYYPMLVPARGQTVQGVVLTAADGQYQSVLRHLDALEGFDPQQPGASAYQRKALEVVLADGQTQQAWIYVGQKKFTEGKPIIDGGDWVAHTAKNMPDYQTWWEAIHSVDGLL